MLTLPSYLKTLPSPDMDKPDADCSTLTKQTHETIRNEVVQRLFAIVQKNSVEVSMTVALI